MKDRLEDKITLTPELVTLLLDVVQDGLCVIDRDMNIVYSNPALQYWYGEKKSGETRVNREKGSARCYALYHHRKDPCPDCPALKAFAQGTPQTGMQILETGGKVKGRQRLFCVPFSDDRGDAFVVEYVRDITDEKMAESSAQLLEEQNRALQAHLARSREEKRRVQEETEQKLYTVVNAIKQSLSKLLDQRNYLRIERLIDQMLDSFGESQYSLAAKLSDQERMVAGYILEGYISKEIAEKMDISKKTVDYHRAGIRKKMKLGPGEDLRERLKEELY